MSLHEARRNIGGNGDDAATAEQHQSERRRIVTAVDGKTIRQLAQQVAAPLEPCRCIPSGRRCGEPGKARRKTVSFCRSATVRPRHVVENLRNIDGLGNRPKMAVEPLLRGLVVIRHPPTGSCRRPLLLRTRQARLLPAWSWRPCPAMIGDAPFCVRDRRAYQQVVFVERDGG